MTTTTTSLRTQAPPRGLTPLGLLTLLLGTALPMIDFFIVNVALPTIEHDLHASAATLEMVVAGYAVAYAVLLVLGGRLGDGHGRRRLFLWGVAGFGVTSLACGLAPSAGWLVAARVAQGAASAALLPQVLATIHATTSGERRARAVALYGSVGGVSVVLGQVLGGVLVAADPAGTGWRAVFLVNVPVALAALVCAVRAVPDSRVERPARGDLAGTALLAATLTALLLPLTEGRAAGWPLWSVLLLCAAPVCAAGFYRVELRAERAGAGPLLPPSLLAAPEVRRGLLLGLPVFIGFAGWMFVSAVTLQQGLGYGALGAGLTLVPMGAAQFAASMLAPRAVRRFGGRAVTLAAVLHIAGLATVTATALLGPWPRLSPLALSPGLVLCGLGQGLQLPLYYRILLAAIPARLAGVGSGLAATLQQSCLAVGVATLGSLFLSLAPRLGMREALAVVLAVQAVGLAGLGMLGLRLPRVLGQ
ncbi:MFS transporter [Streptomyces sp. NPDC052101]|uniref:MFS transporter n=1 Tax=Streptomyces sp. NPDC052101 TaxID=3155763 RepID=UPI0034433771